MEKADLETLREFRPNGVIKKVPLLSDHLFGSLLFLDGGTETLPVRTKDLEEIHYVIEGGGRINCGKNSEELKPGSLLLIPPARSYSYVTDDSRAVILIVRPICTTGSNPGVPGTGDMKKE
jgi:mannose-6-phosphate isomerase-like protein (cupin superfamily)